MNVKFKGYVAGAVAAATYGTNPLFALPLYAEGMNASSVLFFRYLLAVPMVWLMLTARGRSTRPARTDMIPLTFMGLLMAASSILLFESYRMMDAGIASTLLFVYPLMVAVIMSLFFGERIKPLTLMCILLALGGIALLFKRPDGATLSIAGTVMVMLSSLSYAGYIVGMNRPGLHSVPTLKAVFWVLATGALLFGLRLACDPTVTMTAPHNWRMWGCVLALAFLPTVVSFALTTLAVQYIGPTPTAILGALEPVTAVAIGVSAFGEQLSARDCIGLVLIIVAVSLVVGGNTLSAAIVRLRKMFPSLRHRKKG